MRRVCLPVVERSVSTVMYCRRWATTGAHHSFKPGRLTLAVRAVFEFLTPKSFRKRVAMRMQAGMELVEGLEREQLWLRTHGSPLEVLGLPDHAALSEVRTRYRDRILETHPDTAPSHKDADGVVGTVATVRDRDLSDYHILQAAYKMATNPNSLWHQNRSAPELYEELVAAQPMLRCLNNKINLFAVGSYCVMLFVGTVVANYVFLQVCERGLELLDPAFYGFMLSQEKEEQRKRDAGEFVDTDPKRYAATPIRKLAYPGRFVHGQEQTPEAVAAAHRNAAAAAHGASLASLTTTTAPEPGNALVTHSR